MLTMKSMTSNNQQRNHTMTTHMKSWFIHLGWLGYVVSTNFKKNTKEKQYNQARKELDVNNDNQDQQISAEELYNDHIDNKKVIQSWSLGQIQGFFM